MFIILGFYKSTNESKGWYVKFNILFAKNKFEGKSTNTKVENPNRANKRGTTNSTNNFTKIRFQNQNRACKGTNRSIETKFKIKVKHVKEQINLQKLYLNIKVEEGSKTYIINKIYNQIFKSI